MYINAILASLLFYDTLTCNIYNFLCTFGLVQFSCVILFSNLGKQDISNLCYGFEIYEP